MTSPAPSPSDAIDVAIYFGSTNGDTARVVQRLVSLCEYTALAPRWEIETIDVAAFFLDDMPTYDLVLIGAPTWDNGQLQRDWEGVFTEFDDLDLTDLPVALFGLGDQYGYPDTFVDALAFFADKLEARGACLLGRWDPASDPAGYHFTSSWALQDGRFVGLVLDEINQPEQSDARLRRWLAQVQAEFAARTAHGAAA
jgi:flavodoxin long chain